MRIFYNLLFLIGFFNTSSAQFFEGKIYYVMTYKSIDSNQAVTLVINTFMASRKEMLIKDGSYKVLMDGVVDGEAYDSKTNMYSYRNGFTDSIVSVDASTSNDSVTGFEFFNDTSERILNIPCQKVEIRTKSSLITVFYSKKYPLNYSLFSKHLINQFGIILDKTRAVPLKTIIRNDKVITEITAVLVLPTELRDSDLQL
jgi:hypothetical protein